MAQNKGLGLPQTRGSWQTRGITTGTTRDSFFTEKLTKNNKEWRSVNFGVQFDPNSTIYVGMNGMERDNVYFNKRAEEKGGKSITKAVPWKDRDKFDEEGFTLLGVTLGVTQSLNDKGVLVNDKKRMVEFDACKEIADNLKDDRTVFVKGDLEYSEYNGRHQTRFNATQVSLGKDIDFEAEGFTPTADFTQVIVYMGCTPNADKTKATISAKIVNYDNIQDAEFIMYDMNLARMFNKKLKPYTSIKTWGYINVVQDTTEVEETDCWGVENKMERVNTPTVRELVIIGADPTTIDTETYSEKEMDAALDALKASKAAENDFNGNNSTWGAVGATVDDDDDDWA